MDLNRNLPFTYEIIDGQPTITAEGGLSIYDNDFTAQRSIQDAMIASLREEVGVPSTLTGIYNWWNGIDGSEEILSNVAALEDPNHTFLMLHNLRSELPDGVEEVLDLGHSNPEYRTAVHAALQNEGFREYLMAEGAGFENFAEFLDTPNVDAALIPVIERIAAGEFDDDFSAIGNVITESVRPRIALAAVEDLREDLRSMEPAARFTALRDHLQNNGGSSELITALNDVDPSVQESLGNAFAYNDQFAVYVIDRMTPADGADAAASANFASLLENISPEHAPYIANILNTIAQDPSYDVEERLDPLVEAVTEHTDLTQQLADARAANASEAEIAELRAQIGEANTAMIRAVSAAGGNVPALAGMDGAMMMAFMTDLVSGAGVEGAIANLGNSLGMDAEQLAALQELIGPYAGIIQFMVEPYAELYQEHGTAIAGFAQEHIDLFETANGGGSVEFTDEAAAAARAAAADRLAADSAAIHDGVITSHRDVEVMGTGIDTEVAALNPGFNEGGLGDNTDLVIPAEETRQLAAVTPANGGQTYSLTG